VSRGEEVQDEPPLERQGVVSGEIVGLMENMGDEKMYGTYAGTLWIRRGVTLNLNSS